MLVERYHGGAVWMLAAGIVGLVGMGVTIWGFIAQPADAYHAYLIAFIYWFGMAAGALLLLAILNAAGARWPTVLRRPIEGLAGAVPIFAVLLIPVLVGMPVLYRWMNPEANFNPTEMHHFHGAKHVFLQPSFFLVRQVIYFGIFILASERLLSFSRRLDEEGGYEMIRLMRRWSSGLIPFLGLALTFAAVDWVMTLTPFWQQTMFGVYYFAGSFLAAIAMITLVSVLTRSDRQLFGHWLTRHHHHNLGKLLLAFTAFWAYIAFSQFMLVWIANLPEETPYYWIRTRTPWMSVSMFLIVGHFALPFLLLLPRTTKLIPPVLGAVSGWILFACYVDMYWLVMPKLYEDGPVFSIFLVSAFLAVGGLASAFALWRVRGRYMLPVRDPYLEDSLRYAQP
jgi:hypothetical protein